MAAHLRALKRRGDRASCQAKRTFSGRGGVTTIWLRFCTHVESFVGRRQNFPPVYRPTRCGRFLLIAAVSSRWQLLTVAAIKKSVPHSTCHIASCRTEGRYVLVPHRNGSKVVGVIRGILTDHHKTLKLSRSQGGGAEQRSATGRHDRRARDDLVSHICPSWEVVFPSRKGTRRGPPAPAPPRARRMVRSKCVAPAACVTRIG